MKFFQIAFWGNERKKLQKNKKETILRIGRENELRSFARLALSFGSEF